uniref:Uncharacterized protein MANES_04G078800 n=1 Tax=Rhizophora mucronata TaxID=61149 RepID=A0A2P2L7E9_RHIMU
MSLTVASFAIIASSSCEDKSKESPVDNLPILKLSSFKRLGVENPCRKPTPYRSKTGIGILRSWKATSDTRNTSPMHAPLALKPPAVPALITKSGFRAWMAAYVARAAGTVPILSTPRAESFPDHTKLI